ncbi:MAG: hypothetical protein ACJAUP_003713 [Cellvibrionaceae bacterium]|jgi:hypothetical protein
MSRPLRIEFPGALYHLTSRGDGRDDIYLPDEDRALFLTLLGQVCEEIIGVKALLHNNRLKNRFIKDL